MRASQTVFKVRRQYSQWVANETLEDYALRFTAEKGRRWSVSQVGNTALGATAFLALEALAATITLHYGFIHAFWAIISVSTVFFLVGFPICYHAAKQGLDIDLLTRSAGFGYLGSTVTSLIYATFTFIFFAIEAAIMASALEALFGIPTSIGYVLCAIVVIPIVTHGITAISRFQVGTQAFWLGLQIIALLAVFIFEFSQIDNWQNYQANSTTTSSDNDFNLMTFGAAAAFLFALIAQIGEQVDYLRFLPQKTEKNNKEWWFWLILAGPGWVFIGVIKMLLGSFLAYIALSKGTPLEQAIDPVYMYQIAFGYFTNSPYFALILSGIMVIISQMKINVTNAYAGSIAWSNFFSRLTHNHPGRVVWLVFNVAIALLLMELGIYRVLESVLSIFAIVAISWLGAVSADLTINYWLGIRPKRTEFKRSHLYDINPVGFGSMLIAGVFGISAYLGQLGETLQAVAHFATLLVCVVSVPVIGKLTKGKYYLARQDDIITSIKTKQQPEFINAAKTSVSASKKANLAMPQTAECTVCGNHFELQDMSYCPAYQDTICSLCCSLDSRCLDACKPDARLSTQFEQSMSELLPSRYSKFFTSRIGRFLGIFITVNALIALLLSLIYLHVAPQSSAEVAILDQAVVSLFFMLMIVFGVLSWLFLLAHESREGAQKESNRQASLLLEEIEAHSITDASLQEAKELAESANLAKSRYLSGISHELRTPLQSMLGYTQLLLNGQQLDGRARKHMEIIKRNGDYLTDLIEGLLDISKIEAGRLELYRNHVKLPEMMDQMVDMFRPQAQAKGLEFNYHHDNLPPVVAADQKRLRQILINLLSNAVKYTKKGSINFSVTYRHQIAEIIVRDTGIGISKSDLERILNPFERAQDPEIADIHGSGLGLTIVRLLTEIMGGELSISSEISKGSGFKVSLMLTSVNKLADQTPESKPVIGYEGARKTAMVVDDEAIHRGIIRELLQPIGFHVIEAADGESTLKQIKNNETLPDIFMLDVSMREISGLELADKIRELGVEIPIIIISAEAAEYYKSNQKPVSYNAYMVKPISLQDLLANIGTLLHIEWIHASSIKDNASTKTHAAENIALAQARGKIHAAKKQIGPLLRELSSYAESGFTRGVNETIERIAASGELEPTIVQALKNSADLFQYRAIIDTINAGEKND